MEASLPATQPLNGGDGIHTSPFFSALSSTQMGAALPEPKEQDFSANDIQRLLNNTVDDFDNAKWTGSIHLEVIPISSADKDVSATLSSQKPIKVDICKYINDKSSILHYTLTPGYINLLEMDRSMFHQQILNIKKLVIRTLNMQMKTIEFSQS